MKKCLFVFFLIITLIGCSFNNDENSSSPTPQINTPDTTPVNIQEETPEIAPQNEPEPTTPIDSQPSNTNETETNTPAETTEETQPQTTVYTYTYNFYYGNPDNNSNSPTELIRSVSYETAEPTSRTWESLISDLSYTIPTGYLEDYWWYATESTPINHLEENTVLDLTEYNFYLALYDKENGINISNIPNITFPDGLYVMSNEHSYPVRYPFIKNGSHIAFCLDDKFPYYFRQDDRKGLTDYICVDYKILFYGSDTNYWLGLRLKRDNQYYFCIIGSTPTSFDDIDGPYYTVPIAPVPYSESIPDGDSIDIWRFFYDLESSYYSGNKAYIHSRGAVYFPVAKVITNN